MIFPSCLNALVLGWHGEVTPRREYRACKNKLRVVPRSHCGQNRIANTVESHAHSGNSEIDSVAALVFPVLQSR